MRCVLFSVLMLGGCGGAEPRTSPPEPTETVSNEPGRVGPRRSVESLPAHGTLSSDTSFFRLTVQGTNANPEVVATAAVTLPGGTLRPARLGGDVAVVSYAGDRPLEIRFANLAGASTFAVQLDDGSGAHSIAPIERGECDVFLVNDPALTRVDLLVGQQVVRSLSVEELAPDGSSGKPAALPPLQLRTTGSVGLPSYPHIRFLGPLSSLPESFVNRWKDPAGSPMLRGLREPTPETIAFFEAAFRRVEPQVAATVRGVAVAELSNGGVTSLPSSACPGTSGTPRITGGAAGGVFVINSYFLDRDPEASARTLIHETAHVYHEALDKIATGDWAFVFPDIDSFAHERRVTETLTTLWRHSHESAADAGLAADVPGIWRRVIADMVPGGQMLLPRYCEQDAAVEAGFPSIYGASSLNEDVADFVRFIQVDPEGALACRFIRAHVTDEEIQAPALAHVAKASLLRHVGAVSEANYARCVGELPRSDFAGIDMRRATARVDFTSNVSAGFVELDGKKFFRVNASDRQEGYSALITIFTPNYTTPVGLHRLNTAGQGLRTWQNQVLINHEETARRRASIGGLVLITDAYQGTVHGALARVAFRNALFMPTSLIGYAPFHVRGR
ncbi:MAG: hypothetical protein AAGF12_36955 [Myxococcota bacterium]